VFANHPNVTVRMAEVTSLDLAAKQVLMAGEAMSYELVVLAAGPLASVLRVQPSRVSTLSTRSPPGT
jgi:NADH dehydrogenase FAD-containing subunit